MDACDGAGQGVVAVHCRSGLGRTGTLIGLWLMRHRGFAAREAIAWVRIVRPGYPFLSPPYSKELYSKRNDVSRNRLTGSASRVCHPPCHPPARPAAARASVRCGGSGPLPPFAAPLCCSGAVSTLPQGSPSWRKFALPCHSTALTAAPVENMFRTAPRSTPLLCVAVPKACCQCIAAAGQRA
jgi:hypothetical protein